MGLRKFSVSIDVVLGLLHHLELLVRRELVAVIFVLTVLLGSLQGLKRFSRVTLCHQTCSTSLLLFRYVGVKCGTTTVLVFKTMLSFKMRDSFFMNSRVNCVEHE